MEEKKDIFDKIMALPVLRILEPFYKKNKSVLLYLFFGAITTAVSILSFRAAIKLGVHELVANIISWILAVLVAFFTNRTWVFNAPTKGAAAFLTQMLKFGASRLTTLAIEEGIIFLFVTELGFNSTAVKVAAQVVVLVLNYVFSRLIVFRRNKKQ